MRISLLTALTGAGLVSRVTLYARVPTITDAAARTQAQIDKQVDHCVDREEYLRRDREVQRALERMATKDELRDVNDTLRSIQDSIAPHRQ
jgi:galactokinase